MRHARRRSRAFTGSWTSSIVGRGAEHAVAGLITGGIVDDFAEGAEHAEQLHVGHQVSGNGGTTPLAGFTDTALRSQRYSNSDDSAASLRRMLAPCGSRC